MGNKHFEKGGEPDEEEELDKFIMENSKDLIKDFVSLNSDKFRAYCKDILDERKAESSQ